MGPLFLPSLADNFKTSVSIKLFNILPANEQPIKADENLVSKHHVPLTETQKSASWEPL